jgi:GT2 family glycosyltransferase
MSKISVSIIIPCFNAVNYTKQCIESILINTDISYELILINNGSTDDTKTYFNFLKKELKPSKYLKKVTILQFKNNLGVAKSLNLGISKSVGKYVCYLNNDIIVTKEWLSKAAKAFKIDTKIAAVGTMFNKLQDKNFIKLVEKDKSVIDKISKALDILNHGKIKQANTIHGMCMLIKKNVFKKLGFFNENFYPCFGEDIEFCERLKKNGYKIVDAADVFIFHYWHRSVKSKQFDKKYKSIRTVITTHQKKYSIPKKYNF